MISPINPLSDSSNSLKEPAMLFNQAYEHTQFLDREMPFELAEFAKVAMVDFLSHRDVDKVTKQIEEKRQQLIQPIK